MSEIPKESFYWLRKTIAHHKGFECKIEMQMSHDKNFIKTKSSLSVQKKGKDQTLLQSTVEEKEASISDNQYVGALQSLMEWC